MIASRPPGSSPLLVFRNTRAGSPNSLSVPLYTAPAKAPSANGMFSASVRAKEGEAVSAPPWTLEAEYRPGLRRLETRPYAFSLRHPSE